MNKFAMSCVCPHLLHTPSLGRALMRAVILQPRINHLFWKQRKVDAMMLNERFE